MAPQALCVLPGLRGPDAGPRHPAPRSTPDFPPGGSHSPRRRPGAAFARCTAAAAAVLTPRVAPEWPILCPAGHKHARTGFGDTAQDAVRERSAHTPATVLATVLKSESPTFFLSNRLTDKKTADASSRNAARSGFSRLRHPEADAWSAASVGSCTAGWSTAGPMPRLCSLTKVSAKMPAQCTPPVGVLRWLDHPAVTLV